MNKLFSQVLAVAALCVAGAAGATQAQDSAPSANVRIADLNLASPSGLATFRGRVKAAANRICGSAPAQLLEEARAVAECRAGLVRSAEAQIRTGTASVEVTGTH